jgi:hypothetical protein
MPNFRKLVCLAVCGAWLALIAGCGEDPLRSPTAARLKGVADVYLDYAAAKGVGPASVETLEAHRSALPEFVAGPSGGGTSEWRTSLRDGQLFDIRYALAIRSFGGNEAALIACEREGEAGKVLAVDANARVQLIDAAKARELMQTGK